MVDSILGLLLSIYILYGFGFAFGLMDDKTNFPAFLLVVVFWPFFRGLKDGEEV